MIIFEVVSTGELFLYSTKWSIVIREKIKSYYFHPVDLKNLQLHNKIAKIGLL